MTGQKEFRPRATGAESESVRNAVAHSHSSPSEAPQPGNMPPFTNDVSALERFRNCYAVLVQGKRVRRHLYLNLPGAIRAMERAQARGDRADLVLLKMIPVNGRLLHLETGEADD